MPGVHECDEWTWRTATLPVVERARRTVLSRGSMPPMGSHIDQHTADDHESRQSWSLDNRISARTARATAALKPHSVLSSSWRHRAGAVTWPAVSSVSHPRFSDRLAPLDCDHTHFCEGVERLFARIPAYGPLHLLPKCSWAVPPRVPALVVASPSVRHLQQCSGMSSHRSVSTMMGR